MHASSTPVEYPHCEQPLPFLRCEHRRSASAGHSVEYNAMDFGGWLSPAPRGDNTGGRVLLPHLPTPHMSRRQGLYSPDVVASLLPIVATPVLRVVGTCCTRPWCQGACVRSELLATVLSRTVFLSSSPTIHSDWGSRSRGSLRS